MISRAAEYALRVIVTLGSNPEGPRTTHQIAEQAQVPLGYLAKVLQALSRAGLVVSQRGLNGGFVLSRSLDEMSVLNIVSAVDPLKRIEHCPLGLAAPGNRLCSLHGRLDQGTAQLEAFFRATAIGQLLAEQEFDRPLCEGVAQMTTLPRQPGELSKNEYFRPGPITQLPFLLPVPCIFRREPDVKITRETPVGAIVAERLGRAEVFDRLGIDYCCHGGTPLETACAEHSLDLGHVLTELSESDLRATFAAIRD